MFAPNSDVPQEKAAFKQIPYKLCQKLDCFLMFIIGYSDSHRQ